MSTLNTVYNSIMRNISMPAVILSVKQSGENNRTLTLLTQSEGIIYATLFGGPKSRLRSLASQFNSGVAYLYHDEVKKSFKITDFDVKKYHPSFNENLFKTYAASFGAEIIIKTRCAGSPDKAFYYFNGLIDGMELSSENDSRLGLIRFLWRYMELLGVRPDTSACCKCGQSFLTGKITGDAVEYISSYSEIDNGFLCTDCMALKNQRFILSRHALTYLQATAVLTPKEVRQIQIDGRTLTELKDFCYSLIQNACDSKLLSLQSGLSIL